MDGSNQWYMAIGGHQVGPVGQQEIIANLQNGSIDSETLVFTAGMAQWQKVKDVPAFAGIVTGSGGATAGAAPGAFTSPARVATASKRITHNTARSSSPGVERSRPVGHATLRKAVKHR